MESESITNTLDREEEEKQKIDNLDVELCSESSWDPDEYDDSSQILEDPLYE